MPAAAWLSAALCCCFAAPTSAGWVKAWEEQGSVATTDLGKAQTNALFASRSSGGIFRYDIKGVPFAFFKKVPTSSVLVDPYSIFTDCFTTAHHGVLNKDFQLFGTEADLWAGASPWQYCNYDDCAPGAEVGAFRDCAPTSQAPSVKKFHNLPKGSHQGQPDTTFYVYVSTWGWRLLTFAAVASCAYVGGGVLYGRRVRGGGGGGNWLAAHPHGSNWVEVHGLCADGVAFVHGRVGGNTRPQRREPLLESDDDRTRRSNDETHDDRSNHSRKSDAARSPKQKSAGKEKKKKKDRKSLQKEEGHPAASSVGEPEAAAAA
jgi:hypothetical protein